MWGKGTNIRIESCCSFGGRLGLGFGRAESLASLGKMNFYGFVSVRSVIGGVSIGQSSPIRIVSLADGCEPS